MLPSRRSAHSETDFAPRRQWKTTLCAGAQSATDRGRTPSVFAGAADAEISSATASPKTATPPTRPDPGGRPLGKSVQGDGEVLAARRVAVGVRVDHARDAVDVGRRATVVGQRRQTVAHPEAHGRSD